jgi:hypothetical protein
LMRVPPPTVAPANTVQAGPPQVSLARSWISVPPGYGFPSGSWRGEATKTYRYGVSFWILWSHSFFIARAWQHNQLLQPLLTYKLCFESIVLAGTHISSGALASQRSSADGFDTQQDSLCPASCTHGLHCAENTRNMRQGGCAYTHRRHVQRKVWEVNYDMLRIQKNGIICPKI